MWTTERENNRGHEQWKLITKKNKTIKKWKGVCNLRKIK